MVGRGRPRNLPRRNADRGNDGDQRDPRDIEIERLQQRVRDLKLQQEIPDFHGNAQPDEFIDWLSTVERVFDLRDIPDHVKVESWDKMKKLLQGKFLPINHRQKAFLEYHNLTQNNLFVEDLIVQFDRLRMRCRVEEKEEQGLGHLAKECPNKQLITFVDDPTTIYDTANEDEAINEETKIIYVDHGEALITQQVLNVAASPIIDDNSWLRNNIFHTKCTSKGKVRILNK
ncbi:reverse transcriptase domain-containing protein [Tanacetum coccineum]|uniref:Reverse transcriptase domain-containing protein n=1 Tax=Tanacetum coccineum TaxID=301880 RepID=A0ABQ5FED8_9ASTR